jgi:Ser/Thr protein kinase RdoA (MazF antagonist)
MARLQEHTSRQFVPSKEFTRLTPDALTKEIAEAITGTLSQVRPPEDIKAVEVAIEKVQRTFEGLGTGPDVFGLIHADLHQSNYLFYKGKVRAIDLDDCGYAHFLYDLAVTLNELMHKPNYPQLRSSLLRGYRSVRPLSQEHESYLDTIIAFRELQLITWVVEQRNHPAFGQWKEYATNGLHRIKALTQV